jgi:hypothetical protein
VFQPLLNQREPPLLNQQRVFQLLLNQHEPPLLNQQRESHQRPSQTHLIFLSWGIIGWIGRRRRPTPRL